ncbi:hypothetical protein GCM10023353_17680 [Tomitella cavernea]|uniref:Uncharacterized protein n=1 Tax=Tomitella cavernea TaxID=1387982 RepID=A0ABP9CNP6_9ACTN
MPVGYAGDLACSGTAVADQFVRDLGLGQGRFRTRRHRWRRILRSSLLRDDIRTGEAPMGVLLCRVLRILAHWTLPLATACGNALAPIPQAHTAYA